MVLYCLSGCAGSCGAVLNFRRGRVLVAEFAESGIAAFLNAYLCQSGIGQCAAAAHLPCDFAMSGRHDVADHDEAQDDDPNKDTALVIGAQQLTLQKVMWHCVCLYCSAISFPRVRKCHVHRLCLYLCI